MRTFVTKLAAWHRLFNDLENARRLANAEPDHVHAGEEQDDVRRLQCACDQALDELRIATDALMSAQRVLPSARPDGSSP